MQTALFVVIIVLTLLLVALGAQVFFILRDFRKTVSKANKVLDDTGVITQSVSGPISMLSSLATGIKAGTSILSILKIIKKVVHQKEGKNG